MQSNASKWRMKCANRIYPLGKLQIHVQVHIGMFYLRTHMRIHMCMKYLFCLFVFLHIDRLECLISIYIYIFKYIFFYIHVFILIFISIAIVYIHLSSYCCCVFIYLHMIYTYIQSRLGEGGLGLAHEKEDRGRLKEVRLCM